MKKFIRLCITLMSISLLPQRTVTSPLSLKQLSADQFIDTILLKQQTIQQAYSILTKLPEEIRDTLKERILARYKLQLFSALSIKALPPQIISRSYFGVGGDCPAKFSPDGTYALAPSGDTTARLWNMRTGSTMKILEGHTDTVNSVALSENSKYALTGSNDGTARLWDLTTGATIGILEGHTDLVMSVAFSKNSQYALTGSWDETARLWNLENGTTMQVFQGHTAPIMSVAFHPDGKYILTGSEDGSLHLWDIKNGETVKVFERGDNTIRLSEGAFSPDGRYVLTQANNKPLYLWDIHNLEAEPIALHENSTDIISIAFNQYGTWALTGSADTTARLWPIKHFIPRGFSLPLVGHTHTVASAVFSPDGQYALTGSCDKTARLWDLTNSTEVEKYSLILLGNNESILSVDISPDGKYALASSDEYTVYFWDLEHHIKDLSLEELLSLLTSKDQVNTHKRKRTTE